MSPCQYWITGDFCFLNRALAIPSHKKLTHGLLCRIYKHLPVEEALDGL